MREIDFNAQQEDSSAGAYARPLRSVVGRTAAVIAGTALVALCAHIAIPLVFTPVPVTLQPFAVLLLGILLGPRLGFITLALYLAEGALGLPVFNPHGPGGLPQLFGPTGGYLLAAPFAASLAGWLYRRAGRSFASALAGAAAGDLLLLGTGALWLGVLEHSSVSLVLSQSVLPFLLSDAAKVIAAAGCVSIFRSFTAPPKHSPKQP